MPRQYVLANVGRELGEVRRRVQIIKKGPRWSWAEVHKENVGQMGINMDNNLLRRLLASAAMVFLINSSAGAGPRVLIPNAPQDAATWRYTTAKPGDGWTRADFDDGKWAKGKAGFGLTDYATPPETIGTPWKTPDIWLRKTIDVPAPLEFTSAGILVRHDEDTRVYLNGRQILSVAGFNTKYTAYDVTKEVKAAMKPGRNIVAVHVSQTGGGQYIDVGLVLDPKPKLIVPVKPMAPAALQKLRDARWSVDKAWQWYRKVGPISGCNYLPRTAVNSTEMGVVQTRVTPIGPRNP